MGLTVLPALIPDIPQVYDAYFAAFAGNAILDILFPGGVTEELRKGHSAFTLDYWHKSRVQYTLKCVETETGAIVGMALWDVYLRERGKDERKNPGVTWLDGKEKERAERMLGPLWENREVLWGGSRYVYCQVVGVHPNHQGKGAGKLLLKWGMDVAEAAGLPVYLESSPEAYRMYQKLGFDRVGSVIHKPEVTGEESDVEVPLLVKMPSLAGGVGFKDWAANGYRANYQ